MTNYLILDTHGLTLGVSFRKFYSLDRQDNFFRGSIYSSFS